MVFMIGPAWELPHRGKHKYDGSPIGMNLSSRLGVHWDIVWGDGLYRLIFPRKCRHIWKIMPMRKRHNIPRRRAGGSETQKSKNESSSKPSTNESDEDTKVGMRGIKDELSSYFAQRSRRNEEQKAADDQKRKLDARVFWVAVIAVVANIGLMGLTYCQFQEAQKYTLASNRAWLAPENFTISLTPVAPDSPMSFPLVGKVEEQPFVSVTIKGTTFNVGHEPATNVLFAQPDFGYFYTTYGDPTNFKFPVRDMCGDLANDIARDDPSYTGSTIFPNEPWSYDRRVPIDYPGGPDDFLRDLNAGSIIFYWRDCIGYKTFGRIHTSPFCVYAIGSGPDKKINTFNCPVNNGAN